MKTKICIQCNKEFNLTRNPNQVCCSRSCNAKNHNKLLAEKFVPPNCKQCGKPTRRESRAKFCSTHCQQTFINGKNNPMYKTGRKISSEGYVYILKPEHLNAHKNGYILEHRYLMSEYIGRPLERKEIVHHINGIKDDNRIENLELLTSQIEHIKKDGHILGRKYIVRIELNDSPL